MPDVLYCAGLSYMHDMVVVGAEDGRRRASMRAGEHSAARCGKQWAREMRSGTPQLWRGALDPVRELHYLCCIVSCIVCGHVQRSAEMARTVGHEYSTSVSLAYVRTKSCASVRPLIEFHSD